MYPASRFAILLAAFCLLPLAPAEAVKLKIAEAHPVAGQAKDKPGIEFRLTPSSTRRFFKFTKKYLDKRVAIKADGRVILSATIKTPISSAISTFYFDLSNAEAAELAQRLNSGKAKLEIVPAAK
jgi:preprotein translocase subunit SecD